MAEELKIVLAVDGADKVAAALDNTSEALKDTADEAKRAGDALNKTLKPGAAQAQNTLLNLSRVAQDAPYGFIGIANNINPLVESFGRLKQESGSVGTALKTLVSSLAGPAGLGLAVGVLSSLLVTFAGDLFKSNDALEEVDNTLETVKKNINSVSDAFKNFEAVGSGALDVYNSLADIKFGKGPESDALKRSANYIDLSEKSLAADKALADAKSNLFNLEEKQFKNQADYNAAVKEAQKAVSDASAEVVKYTKAVFNQGLANKQAEIDEKNAAKERLKNIDTISKTLAKLKEDLKDEKALSLTFNTSTLKEQAKLVESAIEKIVTKFNLSPANTLKLKVALLSGNGAALGSEEIGKLLNQLQAQLGLEQFTKNLKPLTVTVPVDLKFDSKISSSYKAVGDFLEKQKKEAEKLAQQKIADFQSIITEFAMSSAMQIGELLGAGLYAAITGQANGIADAFKSLFMLFGDAVQSLGKYAIQYSAAMEGLKKALAGASGLAGIGIGIGLIALGALIKAAIGGIGKVGSFAVGTNFAPGGMALVGERGPELVNLPRGSQVVPAAQTSAMLGGRQNVEVFGVLRGQDIYFSNKRYGQTYNRQT